MDTLSSMNNALSYIEEHLTEDIDYSEISKKHESMRARKQESKKARKRYV